MSRGLGRIERQILKSCSHHPVLISVDGLTGHSTDNSRRKTAIRAMHSFVRKYPQYALTGGKGRHPLYLYQPDDPLSVTWAAMRLEPRRSNDRENGIAARDAAERLASEWRAAGTSDDRKRGHYDFQVMGMTIAQRAKRDAEIKRLADRDAKHG